MCSVCNISVAGRKYDHSKSFDHIVNLLQSHVTLENDQFYRKVPGVEKFFCFECLKIFENKNLETHRTENHGNCLDKNGKSQNKNYENNNNTDGDGISIEALCAAFGKHFKIDKDKKQAECIDCQTTVKANFHIVMRHLIMHQKEKDTKTDEEGSAVSLEWYYDHGKKRAELAKYGKDNYIKLNEGGSKAYCSLCDTYISASIKVAKQHVTGIRHSSHLKQKGLK